MNLIRSFPSRLLSLSARNWKDRMTEEVLSRVVFAQFLEHLFNPSRESPIFPSLFSSTPFLAPKLPFPMITSISSGRSWVGLPSGLVLHFFERSSFPCVREQNSNLVHGRTENGFLAEKSLLKSLFFSFYFLRCPPVQGLRHEITRKIWTEMGKHTGWVVGEDDGNDDGTPDGIEKKGEMQRDCVRRALIHTFRQEPEWIQGGEEEEEVLVAKYISSCCNTREWTRWKDEEERRCTIFGSKKVRMGKI